MGRIWPMALMAGVLGGAMAPASAAPEAARWDTYFYAAPRSSARVLDEVERETPLDVLSCEAGWCRVVYGETEGFVREEIVHGPSARGLLHGGAAGRWGVAGRAVLSPRTVTGVRQRSVSGTRTLSCPTSTHHCARHGGISPYERWTGKLEPTSKGER
jgi:hypothetical protein